MNCLDLMKEVDAIFSLRNIIKEMKEKYGCLRNDAVFIFHFKGVSGIRTVEAVMDKITFSEIPRGIIIIENGKGKEKKYRLKKILSAKYIIDDLIDDSLLLEKHSDLLGRHMETPPPPTTKIIRDDQGNFYLPTSSDYFGERIEFCNDHDPIEETMTLEIAAHGN